MSPLLPANMTKQVPPFRQGLLLHGDTDGTDVGSAVGSVVMGCEVVGCEVVGSEVVGSEVAGSEVVGTPVGQLEGADVSAHRMPKYPSAHKQLNPMPGASLRPEP